MSEAVLYALSSAVQKLTWVKHFLESSGIDLEEVTIFKDNMSTISLVKNNKKDGRTKHIEIKKFHIAQTIEKDKAIKLKHIKTTEQLADARNKFTVKRNSSYTEELGIVKIPTHVIESSLEGDLQNIEYIMKQVRS